MLSSRENGITVYSASTFEEKQSLLTQLGKHKTSKASCSIQKLEDIDIAILGELMQ
ncbi:hypothetical protein [Flavobacterium taihuense]|uniref:Uncharacterized protein n=1 Tax=Flavobacterium taihuense TaxID=2857508 RepID=A0ABS6XYJ8_9FLAO|nr:hypothetical protein [Flavobacterium taihuense]MBW4361754.1 hypothetical protein [Flavobacterium taihuense]